MRMKKGLNFAIIVLMIIVLSTLGLGGCVGSSGTVDAPPPANGDAEAPGGDGTENPSGVDTSNAEYTIKIAHAVAESHASHIALEQVFKPLVEENSNGRIVVEIYPNAQLGGDREAAESVSMGTLEMTMCTLTVLAGFDDRLTVIDLPFLFKSEDAAHQAYDNELGDALAEILLDFNLHTLGIADGGFRHITNNVRRITSPEDMNGIKLRTQENTLHVAAFRAFGANPTPMAFSELFTALQQGTVDGQENPINLIYASKFQEVQDYLTLSGHVFGTAGLYLNENFFQNLPDELKTVVEEAATATVTYQRQLIEEQDDEYLALLKEVIDVYELSSAEKDLFIEKAQPVYQDFFATHGTELYDLAVKYND